MSALTYIAGINPFRKIENELWYHGEVQVLPFPKEQILDEIYTQQPYCAHLEGKYTDERAQQVIAYLSEYLQTAEEVELWNIWLGGAWTENDSDTRPKLKSSRVRDAEDWYTWEEWKQHKVVRHKLALHQLTGQVLRDFFDSDYTRQRCLVIGR